MKRASAILTVVVVAAWMPLVAAPADAAERKGEIRGTFLRLAEKQIGEREHLVMVIKPLEGEDEVIVVLPARSGLPDKARRLRKGQKVEIAFVREGDWMWASTLAAERREGDRPREGGERREAKERERARDEAREARRERERPKERPRVDAPRGDVAELAVMVRRLTERVEKLEAELRELRAQNERLGNQLAEKGVIRKERPREGGAALPKGARGFNGMLRGKVVSTEANTVVIKVEKVTRVWESNRAVNAEGLNGREVRLVVSAEGERGERLLRVLRGLKPGDRVIAGAMHTEGNHLALAEELRKVD